MAIKYLAGDRLIGTTAERTALTTSSTSNPATGWKILGRQTAVQDATDFEVDFSSLKKENIMVLVNWARTNSINDPKFQLGINGTLDQGDNYRRRMSANSGTDEAETSVDDCVSKYGTGSGADCRNFELLNIRNAGNSAEKLGVSTATYSGDGGTGTNPVFVENAFKYVHSTASDQIGICALGDSSTTFQNDSEIVVLGCDDSEDNSEDSGSNFWQLLGSTTYSSGNAMSVSFTAHKYLWIQYHSDTSSGNGAKLRLNFNNDNSTGDYTQNYENNFGGSSPDSNSPSIYAYTSGNDEWLSNQFGDIFVVDIDGREKPIIWNATDVGGQDGVSGTDVFPELRKGAGKYNETGRITSVQFTNQNVSGGMESRARVEVWGAN